MTQLSLAARFSSVLQTLDAASPDFVPKLVNLLLREARQHRASDIHLVPSEHSLRMQWRIDGVLHSIACFDGDLKLRILARLKVMAGLLTYRTDVPQEGRISYDSASRNLSSASPAAELTGTDVSATNIADGEVRVTTFPTLFGEKAALRLFADSGQFQLVPELGLPEDVEQELRRLLQQTSGVILLTGPSGSGKTTTVYACLRELVQMFGEAKGLMSLEDPIEVVLPGVTQSQVRPNVGFDLAMGLKSMMRQDPDVIMVGEIRDPETAESAFQAALTGHLVITTFHAGSSVEAVTRLLDMGIEPYLLRSTLQAVVCQRLLRKACPACRSESGGASVAGEVSSNPKFSAKESDKTAAEGTRPESCAVCNGVRYHGRFVTAELLDPDVPELIQGFMQRMDSQQLQTIAQQTGTITLRQRCDRAVDAGLTYADEVFRVLGMK